MTKPPFIDVNEAIDWLNKHDQPVESEYDCNVKHRIRFEGDGGVNGSTEWLEFSSDNDLKEWIEYDYNQMNPEEESK